MLFYDTLERDYRIHTGFFQSIETEVCADFQNLKFTAQDCHTGNKEAVEILPPDVYIAYGLVTVNLQKEVTNEMVGTYSYRLTGALNGKEVLIQSGKLHVL